MPSTPFPITSRLAPTFGALVEAHASADIPDAAAAMTLFEEHGAVVLRGFGFTKESFTTFSDVCCAGGFSAYVGGGFRFRGLDRESKGANGTLLSTTGSTQSFGIPLHGEMYYQAERPDMLWFFCEHAPARKGQTTVADGHALFERLSSESQALLQSRQLLYVRELSAADWSTTFQTTDVGELERICQRNGMTLDVQPDGGIRTEYLSPPVQNVGGRPVYINNAQMLWEFEAGFNLGLAKGLLGDDVKHLPLVVRLDDGSPLPEGVMKDVAEAGEACTVEITWQKGDVVMVDNRRILHGRRKTGGEQRQILVRLGTIAAN
jgi:alpha-ketoglutarate-dependent taurine dioxygenase